MREELASRAAWAQDGNARLQGRHPLPTKRKMIAPNGKSVSFVGGRFVAGQSSETCAPLADLHYMGWSKPYCGQGGSGLVLLCRYGVEVSAQRFQRRSFLLDFVSRSESHAPQDRHRRAPTLDRMLEKKCCDKCRKREPPAVPGGTEYNAGEGKGGSICFDGPLNVPLFSKLLEPTRDSIEMGRKVVYSLSGVILNLLIYFFARMSGYAIKRAGHHTLLHVKKSKAPRITKVPRKSGGISMAGG
jgi:hypothetical protein